MTQISLPEDADVMDVPIDDFILPMIVFAIALVIATWLIDRYVTKKYKN
ncbi:MAG: hypothetical protein WBG71_00020 [Leeuwenhoekiella sp.]